MKHQLSHRIGFLILTLLLALSLTRTSYAAPSSTPVSGSWSGTTSRGHGVSFTVSVSGGQWSSFELETDFNFGSCSGTLTKTVPGPGTISGDQFSWAGSTYAFTGQFTSPTTASGTYNFTNENVTGCGYLTQSGTWSATTSVQVSNDDFDSAIAFNVPYTNTQSIAGATTAGDDPNLSCIYDEGYYSVWYKYTPTLSGTLTVDTFGSTYDTALCIWTGTRGSLTSVGCNDDSGLTVQSKLSVSITAGTTYYIETVSYLDPPVGGTDLTINASQSGSNPPMAFSKTSPTNGSTNQSTSPMLLWDASTGTASYEYCYDTINNSVCDSSWISTSSNTSISLFGLSLNTAYYWQVRAMNTTGTTYADGGTWWSFTTSSDIHWTGTTSRGKPMSFNVNASGTQWSSFRVTANFTATTCYNVIGETEITVNGPGNISGGQFSYTGSIISFTGQFNTANTASGTYSLTNYPIVIGIPNPPYVCTYHLNQTGTWSASTPLQPPGAFGKSTPANGAVGQSVNLALSWGSSTNATSFEYCYDTINNSSCDSSWINVGTNTSANLTGLNGHTTYYWQVRSLGNSATTNADGGTWWSFTTTLFADMPPNYWAASWIERLYNAGITGGCSVTPLNYCPESTVTRAQMAVFLLKGMHSSSYAPPTVGGNTGFTDVATNYWAAAWIKQLAAEGITGGCGSGNYCPEATVTRAQMAVFLLKAKHGSSYSPPAATGVFTDVPVGYWADKWIEQLASEGITGGCGTGTYCPDNSVTRAQMAVFLVKTFNLP